jgi:inosine/xanthosine triphosphate pyrophosphatase family protein
MQRPFFSQSPYRVGSGPCGPPISRGREPSGASGRARGTILTGVAGVLSWRGAGGFGFDIDSGRMNSKREIIAYLLPQRLRLDVKWRRRYGRTRRTFVPYAGLPMRVLFGSRNLSKVRRMQALFATLGIDLVGLAGSAAPEPEEGSEIEHNARLKASFYAASVWAPCMANDYGLRLEGLREDEQPAAHVRRLGGGERATDAEAMQFYRARLRALGGSTRGTWTAALAIAFTPGDVVSVIAESTRTFVDRPSPIVLPGEPLASLQVDDAGHYLSELAFDERARQPSPIDRAFLNFVSAHLPALRQAAGGVHR